MALVMVMVLMLMLALVEYDQDMGSRVVHGSLTLRYLLSVVS